MWPRSGNEWHPGGEAEDAWSGDGEGGGDGDGDGGGSSFLRDDVVAPGNANFPSRV
jgi:hypothetical protein